MAKIILIEDNEELTRMYERAFRFSGHQLISYADGQEGLRALKDITNDNEVGAILLDVMVPHVSGIDLLRFIKREENLKHIPVIILTNSFKKENEDLFLSLGASLYMIKMENDVKDVVSKVIQLIQPEGIQA